MKAIKFELTLEEASKIFKALGKEPFNEVYELIGKLNEQANKQLSGESFKVSRRKKIPFQSNLSNHTNATGL